MKVVEDNVTSPGVSAVERQPTRQNSGPNARRDRECWNCSKRHDLQRRETCPAFGKTCRKCHKLNHFPAKCHSRVTPSVRPVDGDDGPTTTEEIFQMHTSTTNLDDSQLVTLQLGLGSHIRFQVDTGAQCSVLPLGIYKKSHQGITAEARHTGTNAHHCVRRHHTASRRYSHHPGAAWDLQLPAGLQVGRSP